ncbi:MAG: TraR/DksA family transcriptional regulator [Armatimonadaceae bacterium]|jgi:DnaK suppressor protein
MARKDALLKVTKLLLARRNELRKRLGMQLDDMGVSRNAGDVADVSFVATGEEMASQLAQLESNELAQTELALMRLKQGRYGVCDVCEKKIPVGRLNAVPYSVMCVKCQGDAERDGDWLEAHAHMSWGDLRDDDRDLDAVAVRSSLGK